MIATVTAARALQALSAVHAYVDAKTYKHLYQEVVGSFNDTDILPLVKTADLAAAKTRATDVELEHGDIFCAARDYQYSQRSRRYLYQQAYQEKLRDAYELFMLFARENTSHDLPGIIAKGQAAPAGLTSTPLSAFQASTFNTTL